jgi:CubicO group peptidase (beta-lactamase class C family)
VPLFYEPGTKWGYSVATDVLGALLARAHQRALPDVVRSTVTGPLDMRDTDFEVRDRDRLAVPYTGGEVSPERMSEHQRVPFFGSMLSFTPSRIFDPASYPSGGSGMAGTAPDFLSFLMCWRAGNDAVLSDDTRRTMSHNQIGDIPVDIVGPGWGFGLASAVLKDPAAAGTPQSVGTSRWGGVYGNNWFVDPERDLIVVILTNTAISGMRGAFPDAIRDAVYAA